MKSVDAQALTGVDHIVIQPVEALYLVHTLVEAACDGIQVIAALYLIAQASILYHWRIHDVGGRMDGEFLIGEDCRVAEVVVALNAGH